MWSAEDAADFAAMLDDLKTATVAHRGDRGRRRNPHPPSWLANAERAYIHGSSIAQIAARLGYSAGYVHQQLKCAGVQMRRPGPNSQLAAVRQQQAVALHAQGRNLREIGEVLGISTERVRQLLLRAGIHDRHGRHGQKARP